MCQGDTLTAEDVAASLNKIAFPPEGVVSPRSATFMMVDKIAATDPHTVVIQLRFATSAFLPALADPYNWISIPSTITLSRSVLGVMQYAMGRHRPWALRPCQSGPDIGAA